MYQILSVILVLLIVVMGLTYKNQKRQSIKALHPLLTLKSVKGVEEGGSLLLIVLSTGIGSSAMMMAYSDRDLKAFLIGCLMVVLAVIHYRVINKNFGIYESGIAFPTRFVEWSCVDSFTWDSTGEKDKKRLIVTINRDKYFFTSSQFDMRFTVKREDQELVDDILNQYVSADRRNLFQ